MNLNNNLFFLEYDGNFYNTRSEIIGLNKNKEYKFHLNPALENIDWSKEPTKSLKQLYKERAIQIRDNYDYLILYFSGGSDSITVLNAFLDNNIPLDEVVIHSFYQIEEHSIMSCDFAQWYLKNKMYKGITTINKIDFDTLVNINKKNIWEYNKNFTGLMHNIARLTIDIFEQNDYKKYIKRQGKIGHIFGAHYPTILKQDDNYYQIITINSLTLPEIISSNIPFFTNYEMPELTVKQAHVLARYMQKHNDHSNSTRISIRDHFDHKLYSNKTSGDVRLFNKIGTESGHIIYKYMKEKYFLDLYKDTIIPILKNSSTDNILGISKKFLLF